MGQDASPSAEYVNDKLAGHLKERCILYKRKTPERVCRSSEEKEVTGRTEDPGMKVLCDCRWRNW